MIKTIDAYLSAKDTRINSDELSSLINMSGLRTASWATIFWIHLLLEDEPFGLLEQKLRPNTLKRKYIKMWISKGLPTHFYKHRHLMRLAFSLSLQDSFIDLLNAVEKLVKYKLDTKKGIKDATNKLAHSSCLSNANRFKTHGYSREALS